jgi:hypothetical protein
MSEPLEPYDSDDRESREDREGEPQEDIEAAQPPVDEGQDVAPIVAPEGGSPAHDRAETPSLEAERPKSAPPPEPAESRRLSKRTIWTIVGVAAGLLVVCVVAALLAARPYMIGQRALPVLWAGEHMLVAFDEPRGADLYLLKPGQLKSEGTLLVQDVEPTAVNLALTPGDATWQRLGGRYGGFVPGLDWLLLWYERDGQGMLAQMGVHDEAPTEVLDSKGDLLSGIVFATGGPLPSVKRPFGFLAESRDGRSRCYTFGPGSEAQRIARADGCAISLDGSMVFLSEMYSDDLALSALRIDGRREKILLDDVEDVVSYRIASDGATVAYVQAGEDGQQLLSIDVRSGAQQPVSDKVAEVVDYGFLPGGDTLFYVIRRDAEQDQVQLYLSTGDRVIARGASIEAQFTPDAKRIAYLVGDGASGTLHVDPLAEEGERRVVLSQGGVVGYAILDTSPSKIVIPVLQEDRVLVYTADLDGANVIQVAKVDGSTITEIQYVRGKEALYLQVAGDAGVQTLYVVPVDRSEAVRVLDGWQAIELFNRASAGRRLVFYGQQAPEDAPALYSVAVEAGAAPIVLDDQHQAFEGAVFTRNDNDILYTAYGDADADQADVCSVPADGAQAFEVLYEQAALIDVRWAQMQPLIAVQ